MKTGRILIFGVILVMLIFSNGMGQTVVQDIENGVQLDMDGFHVKVQFYNDHIVRVVKWPSQGTSEKLSLSVIQEMIPALDVHIEKNDDIVILASEIMKVKINKNDGTIQYFTLSDIVLLREDDKPIFDPADYPYEENAFHIKQVFTLSEDEGLYGLGQHQDGYMNYRGRTVTLVQSNTDAVTPFLISTQGYGILWDNYSKTIFKDNQNGTSIWSDVGDNVDYYLICGDNMDAVINGYRELTGQAPMCGKWAYGYWQSKEHYDTRDELMAVAEEYRERQIPIDNMIQDWDYWNGAENWSGMFFDSTLFPEPEQMINKLHNMHYHLMISIWPALGPNTAIYKDMLKRGYLYDPIGWSGFRYYDAFNPNANRLYWMYLRDGLLVKGIDGWWIDSTEPDVVNALTKEATEYEMKKVGKNYLGSWARYMNAFSIRMTDALYHHLRNETENQRAYILTRSTFAGQQRNAATTWSGDIGANWEVYKKQIAAGINHCMSGIPYWTFDIGAFVIGAYGGLFMKGGKDPAYQELYTRMFQLGAFTPIFRSHGSETPREIWEMGEFVPVLIQFDHLRYRLLPYIYSLAWKITSEGYTMMRGLPMDFTSDQNTYSIADQFMFGPALMVCPVTDFMYYRPPESSVLIGSEYFKTRKGYPGLRASYFKDADYQNLSLEKIDPNIDIVWYTGRPNYVTDSTYAIRWKGRLIPKETGQHQFHFKCFDTYRIRLNGKELKFVYRSTERYTEVVELKKRKSYRIEVEVENRSTGAARMRMFWKTPSIFAKETSVVNTHKIRTVYLPADHQWINFWTGETHHGGQTITADAPIEICPIFVKAGSIIPMGPFLQYAAEKPADPIELRIYPGADGCFTLYEDENDNYNYEMGIYATIDFEWDDMNKQLTIGGQEGAFPGMLLERTFHVILVGEDYGTGIEITKTADRVVQYQGEKITVQL